MQRISLLSPYQSTPFGHIVPPICIYVLRMYLGNVINKTVSGGNQTTQPPSGISMIYSGNQVVSTLGPLESV